MATPTENVSTIRAFWTAVGSWSHSYGDDAAKAAGVRPIVSKLYYATLAMKELVKQASENEYTRLQVFAGSSIFEQCMTSDLVADKIYGALGGYETSVMKDADSGLRPLRQIMLDGIFTAGTGGMFSARTAEGVTGYLHSVPVSAGGLSALIMTDVVGGAVASALRILRDLAVPQFWLEFFTTQRTLLTLDSRLPTTVGWDIATRSTIKALSAAASGRIATDLAKSQIANLPKFAVGDGSLVPVVPPPAKRWYQRGQFWAAGAIGLVGGAAVVGKTKQR